MGRRVRGKYSRSFTATRTKTKRRFGKAVKTGENTSISAMRFGRPAARWLRRIFRQLQGRQTVYYNSAGNVTSLQNQQGVLVNSALALTDLFAIKAAVATALGATGSSNNIKFFLGYLKYKTVYRSCTNHPVRLAIYDVVPRRTPLSTSYDSPLEAWQKGFTDYGITLPSGLTSQSFVVGNTPFQSPEFRRFFTCVKVTLVNLEPGQQHEHTVYRRINRLVNSTAFDTTGSLQSFPGLTFYQMAVVSGSIGHESTSSTNVTFMPCTVDYARSVEFNYAYTCASMPTYAATNTLQGLAAIANFDQMGEAGDVDNDPIMG